MKRVAIYTRLSPNPDKDDTINQERDLFEFAKRQEWEVVEHYKDIHVSGGKKLADRPQFKRMFEDASKRKFDLVLFWSLDRFSREGMKPTLNYLDQLLNWGVDYRSYMEQYVDSCGIFKDIVVGLMAILANQERVRIIERTRAGLQTARDKGKVLGRPKAKIDLALARKMKGEGMSLSKIAAKFDVDKSTVFRLLKEE